MPDAPTVADLHDEVTCQARDMLDRIAGKWSLSVIHELAWGPRRFTELKGRLGGVSQRMLTATLRGLERDGLVRRTVHPVVPPRVDYELTPLGVSLLDTVCRLMAWTVDHMPDIERARTDFDAAGEPQAS
jgi:DNA-binding HxlR family transcriptional regulator